MKELAVYFTDLHVHNYTKYDKEGSRLANCLSVVRTVFAYANKIGAKIILFGGDWYDTQTTLSTVVVEKSTELIAEMHQEYPDIVLYAISGNHDQATKNLWGKPAVTAINHLTRVSPNFRIIDNNAVVTESGCYITGIPYYEYPEHYKEALNSAVYTKGVCAPDKNSPSVLLIHQTPDGLGNPMIKADTTVHDKMYNSFDLVMCGHIHQSQEITDKFILAGSPLHRDLGDAGDEKGIWVMDLSNPNESLTFVSFKGRYPEFKKVEGYENVDEEDAEKNYLVVQPVVSSELEGINSSTQEQFGIAVGPPELLKNFLDELGEEDDKLLETGLELIKNK